MRVGLIVAGGSGDRLGRPGGKQLLLVDGRPVLSHAVAAFEYCDAIDAIVVVTHPERVEEYRREALAPLSLSKLLAVVPGGATRQASVAAGLAALPADASIVAIHDGARPLVTIESIERAIARLEADPGLAGVVVGHPSYDTLKRVDSSGRVLETPERSSLWAAQTPQVFRVKELRAAYDAAGRDAFEATDDASLIERMGGAVIMAEGPRDNVKVTVPEDVPIVEGILGRRAGGAVTGIRIGLGYDAHAFAEGRALVLGGVLIPHDRGLMGHSDADVLTHALMDAILGAMREGDIGGLFPDTDPVYAGASSIELLRRVVCFMRERGFRLVDADTVLVLERPKIAPYRDEMREHLAEALGVDASCVGVKATTTEGLGYEGRGEGAAAQAVVVLQRIRL